MIEQKLEVIEAQLFKSIQRINIERGRREVRGSGTSVITSPIDNTLVGER